TRRACSASGSGRSSEPAAVGPAGSGRQTGLSTAWPPRPAAGPRSLPGDLAQDPFVADRDLAVTGADRAEAHQLADDLRHRLAHRADRRGELVVGDVDHRRALGAA